MLASGCTAIAYETVTRAGGGLPLLSPMSEVAGRMAIHAGAHCLELEQGGSGMLLGGTAGVAPAKVVVLGGGVAGVNAVRMAIGLEAFVTCIDINIERLYALDQQFGASVNTIFSTRAHVEEYVLDADLVIGAVLLPGGTAPRLVTEAMVKEMRTGSVIVDISIDQGGCTETSKATTHADPTYIKHGVVHYCVANMPGAVARTSTFALNNATLAVHSGAGRQGAGAGHEGKSASAGGPQRAGRQDHASGRRRRAEAEASRRRGIFEGLGPPAICGPAGDLALAVLALASRFDQNAHEAWGFESDD